MPIWHPRMAAVLRVPALGTASARKAQQSTSDIFTLKVRPIRARLLSNPPEEADEFELTCTYDEAGVDPRYLASCEVLFHLGDAPNGQFTPDATNLRFVGMARDVTRELDATKENIVTIKAQDYTCMFLESKPYPAGKVPRYSATLRQAWNTICANTGHWNQDMVKPEIVSSVPNMVSDGTNGATDVLQCIGPNGEPAPDLADIVIGKALPPRLARLGVWQGMDQADSWAVWSTICQSLGLISFVRGNRCIVCRATDYYTAGGGPLFVWGQNVLSLKESRNLGSLSAKNVCVRSYNPLSGTMLEGFFPDPGSPLAAKQKRLGASAGKGPTATFANTYEALELPFAVADQATINDVARMVWERRVRQQLQGKLTTREMAVATISGQAFDLLELQSGDQIQIAIERSALDLVQRQTTASERLSALVAKGYSHDMANFIVSNLDSVDKLPGQFLVHAVTTTFESSGGAGGGSFEIEVDFVNRINLLTGAATIQASNAPPVTGGDESPILPRVFGDARERNPA